MSAQVCIENAPECDEAALVGGDIGRDAAPSRIGITQQVQVAENKNYTANDAGRAQRFVDRHVENIRYVPERGLWLVWQDVDGHPIGQEAWNG